MRGGQRRAIVGGIIFVALGVLFLLEALDLYTLAPAALWPILLIALGIGVLAGIGDDGDDEQSPGIR